MSVQTPAQLRRIRWAVRAALALGIAASVAANVLHAEHNPIARTIAAWPPVALLITVELISRVPVHRRSLGALRFAATAAIAGIAAWVSYWHMAGVAARYGEDTVAAHLIPLTADGLIVVASVSLVELAGRLAAASGQGGHGGVASGQPANGGHVATVATATPGGQVAVRPTVSLAKVASGHPGGLHLVATPGRPPVATRRPSPRGHRAPGVGDSAVVVATYLAGRPDATASEVARATGVARSTVRRHMPPARQESAS